MTNVRKLWENDNITERWPGLAESVRFDEPMSAHTTFQVGGPADLFVTPHSLDELYALLDVFTAASLPVSILGGGSNLLVADAGIRGAVICLAGLDSIVLVSPDETPPDGTPPGSTDGLASPGAKPLQTSPDGTPSATRQRVRVGAGVTMERLTEWCAERSLSGVERFAGLPGTVGGAVFMNARCYEVSISDVFFAAQLLHFQNGRYTLETHGFDPVEWEYKRSPFQKRDGADALRLAEGTALVLSADLSLSPGSADSIRAEMARVRLDRDEKGHFRFPSAGSMFRNNHAFGKPSGRLIDEAGLRGFRVGGAQVAPWHGNIVINAGGATARDIKALVEEVRRRVYEQTGFSLETEVIFAGEW